MPDYYHVTPAANLPQIFQQGLLPQTGPRAKKMSEPVPAVYLFNNLDTLEDACANWLLDEFDENTELVILKVSLPEQTAVFNNFEYRVFQKINPENIQKLDIEV